jgi:ribosome maturation factor RimP
MIAEDLITKLIEEKIEGTDMFAVEVLVKPGNKIQVFIDGDHDVSIEDCINISRHIEHSLDRDREDFELHVSSWGVDQPFKLRRQYKKYVGRNIVVKLEEGKKMEGKLQGVTEEGIYFQPMVKKGKHLKSLSKDIMEIKNKEILEAKGAVSFKN